MGRRVKTVTESHIPTDNELIASSLRGDTAAFAKLVLRYRLMAIAVSYRICGNAALAEDIAQETFIRIWEKLSTFRPEGNFRGWLCRIAANMTIDAVRRKKPMTDIAEIPLDDGKVGPEGDALQKERAAMVKAAIMQLPVPSRAVLVLREYEGLSYQEIADALDIPLGTVKSRLNDARRRLQVELQDYMEQEGKYATR